MAAREELWCEAKGGMAAAMDELTMKPMEDRRAQGLGIVGRLVAGLRCRAAEELSALPPGTVSVCRQLLRHGNHR